MRHKGKKINNIHNESKSNHSSNPDYDVSVALKVLSQYVRRGQPSFHDETGELSDYSEQEQISNSSNKQQTRYTESEYRSFDKLEDRFYSFSKSNEQAHQIIKERIDDKIKENESKWKEEIENLKKDLATKVSNKWFGGVCTVVVGFVTIVWLLSYGPLLNDNKENSQSIDELRSEQIDLRIRLNSILKNFDKPYQNAIDSVK